MRSTEGRFKRFSSHNGRSGSCQQHAERPKWARVGLWEGGGEVEGEGGRGKHQRIKKREREKGGICGLGPVWGGSWRGVLDGNRGQKGEKGRLRSTDGLQPNCSHLSCRLLPDHLFSEKQI